MLIPNRRATDNPAGAGAPDAAYDKRSAEVWATLNDSTPEELYARIDELVATLPPDRPVAPFERACAFDSTGHPDKAVPLYQTALEMGIGGERRRRSVIQLSSSLRNLGRVSEALQLLEAERAMPSDHLDDAVSERRRRAVGHARNGVLADPAADRAIDDDTGRQAAEMPTEPAAEMSNRAWTNYAGSARGSARS